MENQKPTEKKQGSSGLKPRTERGLSLKPSTIIKRAHRADDNKNKPSLKAFARRNGSEAASQWLKNKGAA